MLPTYQRRKPQFCRNMRSLRIQSRIKSISSLPAGQGLMHKSLCTSVLLIIAFTTFAFNTASAFPSQESASRLDTSQQGLRQLVQQAVNNDIKAERRTGNRGMYRLRKESLKGTQVKEIV